MDGDGTGLGIGVGTGDGSDDGLGKSVGLGRGDRVGDGLGLGLGDGHMPSVPLPRISCWVPHAARTIPEGSLYQPRIFLGIALTHRAMLSRPSPSPKARILP